MTVQQEQSYITHVYSGPGDYPFHFTIHNVNNLKVTHLSEVGSPHELVLNSDYTLTFDSSNSTGVVHSVYTATSGSLDIRRVLPIEQLVDYVNNSVFNVEILERSLDYLTLITQDAMREVLIGAVSTNWRGDWVTNTEYAAKDVVVAPNGNWYTATVLHTAGDFNTDLADGKWLLAADISVIEGYKDQANTSANNAATSEANAATSESNAAASAALAQQAIDGGHSLAAGYGIDITTSGSNPIVETISATNIISSDLTLYLSPTGNDTTGDGSQAHPWFSINRAMDYLKDKILVVDVVIQIAAGNYTVNETQLVSHPYAGKIQIHGFNNSKFIGTSNVKVVFEVHSCVGLRIHALCFKADSTDNVSDMTAVKIINSKIVFDQDIKGEFAFTGVLFENSTALYTAPMTIWAVNVNMALKLVNSSLRIYSCSVDHGFTMNPSTGVGIHATKNSKIIFDDYVEVKNFTTGCNAIYADDNSSILFKNTPNLINNAVDYSPVKTTGANTAPNFGNFGSFIMSV